MERAEIHSEGAPKPVGSYSQAIRIGNLVFCAGQIGIDPKKNELVEGGVENEARRVLDNLNAVLDAAGLSFDEVVKTEVFVTNPDDFKKVNEIYSTYFKKDPKPARQSVCVAALPKNAKVEISCIASLG